MGLAWTESVCVFPQALPTESLTLEQQLSQYPLFNQLTAQAQAQLISDLQKQQQALPQGIQLIALPTPVSTGTATASSPSPDSQTTASISISSVRRPKLKVETWTTMSLIKCLGSYFLFLSFCTFSTIFPWKFADNPDYIPVIMFTSFLCY